MLVEAAVLLRSKTGSATRTARPMTAGALAAMQRHK
jgi:hypothetical protein